MVTADELAGLSRRWIYPGQGPVSTVSRRLAGGARRRGHRGRRTVAVAARLPGGGGPRPTKGGQLGAQLGPGAVQADPGVVGRDAQRGGGLVHRLGVEVHAPDALRTRH